MTAKEARKRARETGRIMATHGQPPEWLGYRAYGWDQQWPVVVEVLGVETAEKHLHRGHKNAWRSTS